MSMLLPFSASVFSWVEVGVFSGAELAQDLGGGDRREGVDHLLDCHRPLDVCGCCRSLGARAALP
jgi:hypothetical protein